MPQLQNTAHGKSDVITSSTPNPAPSYAVPKYVTDVAELISASIKSRRMFLTEMTRKCLEAAKKDRDSNQMTSSQPTTNTTSFSTRTVFNTSTSSDTTTKPVTAVYNTSGPEMRRRIEDGRPNQAVTLFAPVGVAEDLSKTQYILRGEIKQELKILKESIATIPFQELNKQIQELGNNLEVQMCTLEHMYKDLKDLILQRTTQQLQLDPSLLQKWNLIDMVLKYSPWTSMWLMLNLVAEDNITDLFPTDWQPTSSQSTIQQKHFQVLTEVMTEMFLHCGLVVDEWVIEVTNYQDFLKVLLHHLVLGNISTTQVTQFIIPVDRSIIQNT